MQSSKNQRKIWIDALKILACFLVVVLHTITYGLGENKENIGLVLYYLGTVAIPIFFMVNGYLQLRREVDYRYVLKKILKIVVIVFIWNCLIEVFKFVSSREMNNVVLVTLKSFLQQGFFYHFWFLGSLILIYTILPLLSKIFNNGSTTYKKCTLGLIGCSLIMDILIVSIYRTQHIVFKDTFIQTFRMWTWLMYFCIGGYINKGNLLQNISKKKHAFMICICTICSLLYQYILAKTLYGNLYAENFYDNIFVIINTVLIFTFFQKLNFKHENWIVLVSSLNMGIYIIHPAIRNVIKKALDNFTDIHNNWINIVILLVVYGSSMVVAYCISKIPKVNKLIKL